MMAVISAYAKQGIKGEFGGEQFYILYRDVQAAALKNAQAFQNMNVSVYDRRGGLRDMPLIIRDLERALAGMSDRSKKATLAYLGFTDRSIAATYTLLGTSQYMREEMAQYTPKNLEGSLAEKYAKMMESFAAQMANLRNNLQIFAIEVGRTIAPALKWLAENVKEATTWFGRMSDFQKQFIVKAAAFAAAAGPVILMAAALVKAAMIVGPIIAIGSALGWAAKSAGLLEASFTAISRIMKGEAGGWRDLWMSIRQVVLDVAGFLHNFDHNIAVIRASFADMFTDLMTDAGKHFGAALVEQLGKLGGGAVGAVSNWFGGSFAEGGVVPGPKGAAKLAVVHGGERILSLEEAGAAAHRYNLKANMDRVSRGVAGDAAIQYKIHQEVARMNAADRDRMGMPSGNWHQGRPNQTGAMLADTWKRFDMDPSMGLWGGVKKAADEFWKSSRGGVETAAKDFWTWGNTGMGYDPGIPKDFGLSKLMKSIPSLALPDVALGSAANLLPRIYPKSLPGYSSIPGFDADKAKAGRERDNKARKEGFKTDLPADHWVAGLLAPLGATPTEPVSDAPAIAAMQERLARFTAKREAEFVKLSKSMSGDISGISGMGLMGAMGRRRSQAGAAATGLASAAKSRSLIENAMARRRSAIEKARGPLEFDLLSGTDERRSLMGFQKARGDKVTKVEDQKGDKRTRDISGYLKRIQENTARRSQNGQGTGVQWNSGMGVSVAQGGGGGFAQQAAARVAAAMLQLATNIQQLNNQNLRNAGMGFGGAIRLP
jgi:hypothetical protein